MYKKLVGLELDDASSGAEAAGALTSEEESSVGAGVDDEASVSVLSELVEASEESLVVVDTVKPVEVAMISPDELERLPDD